MGRSSSIKRQSQEIREKIGRLRNNGCTIDEILAKLKELEVPVSRSALGRHVKHLDEVLENMRESRIVAEAVVKNFGEESEDKTAQANIQMMHSLVMKLITGKAAGETVLDAKEVMFLSSSLQKLTSASKSDVDREIKLRERIEKEIREKASKAIAKTAKQAGLSKEMVEQFKNDVFGVA
ncbi:MAG: DUF3486 family protein [Alphaproteobacteria bacterium]|nr:DUF3486 family protein [Alphaproteobacteria bacterium]